jgi:hypothetical protein
MSGTGPCKREGEISIAMGIGKLTSKGRAEIRGLGSGQCPASLFMLPGLARWRGWGVGWGGRDLSSVILLLLLRDRVSTSPILTVHARTTWVYLYYVALF